MNAAALRYNLVAALMLLVGLAGLVGLQNLIERSDEPSDAIKSLLFIPDHRILHILALGDNALAADLLWVRSVFYIAANDLEEKQEEHYKDLRTKALVTADTVKSTDPLQTDFRSNPTMHSLFFWNLNSEDLPQLLTLAETVTDLDPRFVTPYVHGAMNLGLFAGRYEEAIKLLDKGVRNCPDNWEPNYYRGFLRLFYLNDKAGAAADVTEAAKKTNAPTIVIQLAAALTVGAGEREQAIDFLRSLREVTDDEQLQKKIDDMLKVYGSNAKIAPRKQVNEIGRKLGTILEQTTSGK